MAGFKVAREQKLSRGSVDLSNGGYDYDSLDLTKIPKNNHGVLRNNIV